jgi:hypothetical protein
MCHNRINGCVEVLFENFHNKNYSSHGRTVPQHTDTVPQPTDYNQARVIILAAPGAEVRPDAMGEAATGWSGRYQLFLLYGPQNPVFNLCASSRYVAKFSQ